MPSLLTWRVIISSVRCWVVWFKGISLRFCLCVTQDQARAQAELLRRQEELEKKAAELDRRERELQSHGGAGQSLNHKKGKKIKFDSMHLFHNGPVQRTNKHALVRTVQNEGWSWTLKTGSSSAAHNVQECESSETAVLERNRYICLVSCEAAGLVFLPEVNHQNVIVAFKSRLQFLQCWTPTCWKYTAASRSFNSGFAMYLQRFCKCGWTWLGKRRSHSLAIETFFNEIYQRLKLSIWQFSDLIV